MKTDFDLGVGNPKDYNKDSGNTYLVKIMIMFSSLALLSLIINSVYGSVVNSQTESFTTSDSVDIDYDVYYDNALSNQPMLVISPAYDPSQTREYQRTTAAYFASLGYFVMNVDTRGKGTSDGTEDNGAKKCIELTEVFDDVENSYSSYLGDLKYIGGGSGGGGTTLQCLVRHPDFYNGGFDWFGISNYSLWWTDSSSWRTHIENAMGGDAPADDHEKYESRNSYFGVQNIYTPLIIMHNVSDIIVGVVQSRQMNISLQSLDRDIEYYENSIVHSYLIEEDVIDNTSTFFETKTSNIILPSKASLKVLGYLQTKDFRIDLNNEDKVGEVNYNHIADENYILRTRSSTDDITLTSYNKQPSTTYYLTYQNGTYSQNTSNVNGEVSFVVSDLGNYILDDSIQNAITQYNNSNSGVTAKVWSRNDLTGKVVVQ